MALAPRISPDRLTPSRAPPALSGERHQPFARRPGRIAVRQVHVGGSEEERLASPRNVFARAIGDVKGLKAIKAGTRVQVAKIA